MSTTTAYKLVVVEGRNRYSCQATGKAKVTYIKDKKVFAPSWLAEAGYGLLVFDTVNAALSFLAANDILNLSKSWELWKCVVTNMRPMAKTKLRLDELENGIIKKSESAWPFDTFEVDTVTLTRCVRANSLD